MGERDQEIQSGYEIQGYPKSFICDDIMDSLQENMALGCDRFMRKQMQSDLRLYYGTVLNIKTVFP